MTLRKKLTGLREAKHGVGIVPFVPWVLHQLWWRFWRWTEGGRR
jgi:hypothetical protein